MKAEIDTKNLPDGYAEWRSKIGNLIEKAKLNAAILEISPATEHTKDFSPEDWKQLWLDFAVGKHTPTTNRWMP